MDRASALSLLESQHEFPGPFEFRVVVPPASKELTLSGMVAAAGEDARVEAVGERVSRNGNYVALKVRMHLPSSERVLDVYEVLRSFDHVVTAM